MLVSRLALRLSRQQSLRSGITKRFQHSGGETNPENMFHPTKKENRSPFMVPIMASALSFSAAFYVGFTTKPKHANEKTAGELSN